MKRPLRGVVAKGTIPNEGCLQKPQVCFREEVKHLLQRKFLQIKSVKDYMYGHGNLKKLKLLIKADGHCGF